MKALSEADREKVENVIQLLESEGWEVDRTMTDAGTYLEVTLDMRSGRVLE